MPRPDPTRAPLRTVAAAVRVAVTALCAVGCAHTSGVARPAAPDPSDAEAARPPDATSGRTPPAPPLTRATPLPAPSRAAPAPGAVPALVGPRGELVRAGSRVVTTADLGEFVVRWQPDVAATALRRLSLVALVDAEAAREGADVPAALVDAAAGRALDERVRRIRLERGAAADVEETLRRTYGRTLAALRDDFRRAVRTDLLRERLARLDGLRADGVEIRVLVARDERDARTLAEQWRGGADGSLLAARLGLRAPAAPPPLALADVPERPLRDRFAAAAPGTVLDPVPFEAEDPERPGDVRTWWQVFKVVRAWKATAEPWAVVGPTVEASLREAPASDEELSAWEARATRRTGLAVWDAEKGFGVSPPAGTMEPR